MPLAVRNEVTNIDASSLASLSQLPNLYWENDTSLKKQLQPEDRFACFFTYNAHLGNELCLRPRSTS
jgi:hypothetical protein